MPAENTPSERVLDIVKAKGPVVPSQVSVVIGTSSLFASAMLSELVSSKKLRISSVKVGGSPLYYVPGQENLLQNYVKYLHDKEQKAFDLLKSELVLRDSILDPVTRVALRSIKDFAAPLQVQTSDGNIELFWKWYMISNDEAEPRIRYLLDGREAVEEKVEEKQEMLAVKTGMEAQKSEKKPKKRAAPSDFMKSVNAYFSDKGIEIVESFETRTRTGAEFIISVPSPVGSIRYYCMVKGKNICNEGDLSTAYVRGQAKRLPVLFLTTGKLTKKASQMLELEFSSINVKQI